MKYSVVKTKKEEQEIAELAIGFSYFCDINVVAEWILYWLHQNNFLLPSRDKLIRFLNNIDCSREFSLCEGKMKVIKSKDSSWIFTLISYKESIRPSVVSVDQHNFEEYLISNVRQNERKTCPFLRK